MNNDLTYKEIYRFYLPLVLNAQMMFLSAPLINFGLSRTNNPEVAIAAYSVGFLVMVFLNSPSIASRNISTALITDRASFLFIRKIFLLCGIFITLISASIAITPLHSVVFLHILGAPADIAREARRVLLIISPIGIIIAVRGIYQGVALVHKKTSILAYATLVRLTTITTVVFLSTFWWHLPGALSGAISIASGMGIEALFVYLQANRFADFDSAEQNSAQPPPLLRLIDVIRFGMPILIGLYILTLLPTIVNGIISRSTEPEMALAGFGVIYPLMRFITSPLLGFQSTTLVLYKSYSDFIKLTVAVLGLSLFFCVVLLGLGITSLGPYILTEIFALQNTLLHYAYPGFLITIIFPIVSGIRCHAQGILMNLRLTNAISLSALGKVPLALIIGFGLLWVFPQINGVLLGIVLITLGEFCDDVIMGGVAMRAVKRKEDFSPQNTRKDTEKGLHE